MPQSSSSQGVSPRVLIGGLVFASCCLLSTIRVVSVAPNPGHLNSGAIDQASDERFAGLKQSLPKRGVVGYIGAQGQLHDYYLAQYALAPIVVDDSTNHLFVVGNFRSEPRQTSAANLQLVKDFGDGVLLLVNPQAN